MGRSCSSIMSFAANALKSKQEAIGLGGTIIDVMHEFLKGGGRQAAAIGSHDWSRSPLGPIEQWPEVLKIAVAMMLASRFPKCLAWGPDLVTLYNDAYAPILGNKPPALGVPFSSIWAEAWPVIGPIAARAMSGEATFIEDFPLEIERSGYPERAYFTFCYSPVRDENGRVLGMMDTVMETTARVQAEERAELLNAELSHRIGNLLTIIGAIADRTLKSSASLPDARQALSTRLAAMGRAQSVLTKAGRREALVADVVNETLAAHIGLERFTIAGPAVCLDEQQTLALALAINELASNAVKYGALSAAQGRVTCRWSAADPAHDRHFLFEWIEEKGPRVQAPERRGFGSYLIENHVAAAFRGLSRLEFAPVGLRYSLSAADPLLVVQSLASSQVCSR